MSPLLRDDGLGGSAVFQQAGRPPEYRSWGSQAAIDLGLTTSERNTLPHDWRELVRGMGNPAKPFVCPAVNCGKSFQRGEHAKRHSASLHTPDAVKVPCPYPNSDHKSTRGDNLKQRMNSHRREKGGGGIGSLDGSAIDEDKDRK
ncbi:hypothetical protein FRB96_008485, partial [Tulasnella sp. 330]